MRRTLIIRLCLLLALSGTGGNVLAARPPRTDNGSPEIFQGIIYHRQAVTTPTTLMIHSLRINLPTTEIGFFVTPGDPASGMDLYTGTTSNFLRRFGVQVAVNGGFFEPVQTSASYPVNVRGLAISDGNTYSTDGSTYPVLCVSECDVLISANGCPDGTTQAVAGNAIILDHSTPVVVSTNVSPSVNTRAPRTAVAMNASSTVMWLIVVDGRQNGYSEGVTLRELADIALGLGASIALNLDGGGSSTMVMADPNGLPVILNSPIDNGVPMTERPVGNQLGVFALPLNHPAE